MRVKLLSKHSEVRLEVTSDSDLFFLFQFICDSTEFRALKEQQNLYITFPEYPATIKKTFDRLEASKDLKLQFFIYS